MKLLVVSRVDYIRKPIRVCVFIYVSGTLPCIDRGYGSKVVESKKSGCESKSKKSW